MKFRLEDIVFQNDRYYLLFEDENASKLCTTSNEKQILADEIFFGLINDCNLSQILILPNKTVLESGDNLTKLENAFRRFKNVYIITEN